MDCRILFIGDVMGKPGRRAITELLPGIRSEFNVNLVIANVENVSGGKGIQSSALTLLQTAGVDVFTSGNHVWDKPDVYQCFADEFPLLRPANYPNLETHPLPGQDYYLWESPDGYSVAILNFLGQFSFR